MRALKNKPESVFVQLRTGWSCRWRPESWPRVTPTTNRSSHTHTNTSDRLTITQTTTVTPPIIIMKLLTCNSHSNFLPLDAGTNRASSPQTRACTEQPWERELRFTAKIRRLPQMTAKRSESYKRKQDFKAVWVERPPPLGLQVKRVVGRRG